MRPSDGLVALSELVEGLLDVEAASTFTIPATHIAVTVYIITVYE